MQQSTRAPGATLPKASGFPHPLAEPLGDQPPTPGPAPLVGTWKLLSYEVRYLDESVSYPWGPDAQGLLIYSADGYMMVTLCAAHRPHFAGGDLVHASPEEQAQAARTYLSYGGPYERQGQRLVHHVQVSLFPNWVGQDQDRVIEVLERDRLILRTQPLLIAGQVGTAYLIWQRV